MQPLALAPSAPAISNIVNTPHSTIAFIDISCLFLMECDDNRSLAISFHRWFVVINGWSRYRLRRKDEHPFAEREQQRFDW